MKSMVSACDLEISIISLLHSMLFQVALVQQNKSDPNTLQEQGKDVLIIPLTTLNLLNQEVPSSCCSTSAVSSSPAGNIFFSCINAVLLLCYPFLKMIYFLRSYTTLRSAGRVVRGANEHFLRILPAVRRLCK